MPDIEPTDAKRKLLEALAREEVADYTSGDPAKDDPRGVAKWETDGRLRAELLRLVCTGRYPDCAICQHGHQYSADAFLPIINLHQEDFWLPAGQDAVGRYVRVYMWIHIALGWLFTTVFVVGLTGIVRQD